MSQCADDTLNEERVDGSYYWHNAIGGTVSVFNLSGSSNSVIYADNRTFRRNSSGFLFQLDGTPFGRGKSPLGPRFNMRVGVQYTLYTRFDGARFEFQRYRPQCIGQQHVEGLYLGGILMNLDVTSAKARYRSREP